MEIAEAGLLSDWRLGQILTSNLGRPNSKWSDHMTESESGLGLKNGYDSMNSEFCLYVLDQNRQ